MPLEIYSNNSMLNIDDFKLPKYLYSFKYGKGIIQIGKILDLTFPSTPKCNYQSGNYAGELQVELKADYPIYYTLDGSYPTNSSTLYTEPITINKDTDLRAVSYDENNLIRYSDELECEYQIFQLGTEDMFEIDETGCITDYAGNIKNLLVPDIINGTEVKTFSSQIFNDGNFIKLVLPNTINEIPTNAFVNNDIIEYVNTGGAKTIKRNAFLNATCLYTIDMPNVENIETEAFSKTNSIHETGFYINAPQLKYIQKTGFYYCSFFGIEAPKLECLYSSSFCNSKIEYADFPKLKSIEGGGLTRAPFFNCDILKVLNTPNLETNAANTLTSNCNNLQYINLPRYTDKLSISSTYNYLKYCNVSKETAELSGLDYYNVDALGGSIRVTDAGLRFGFSFDENQTKKIEQYGFLYASGEKVSNELIIENVDNKNIFKLIANNRITHDDNTTTFNLVFTDIPEKYFDYKISARAYVCIDGMYFYSPVETSSINDALEYNDDAANDNDIQFEHEHSYTKSLVAPNCETGGYTLYTCKNCKESYMDDFVDALGHNYDFTSYTDGTYNYSCTACNKADSKSKADLPEFIVFVNTKVTRGNVNMYLDLNNDDFINAKDFGKIHHLSKYGW